MFGEDAASQLLRNWRLHEAQFTRVFRRWYEAEEEAGIPASDRHNRHIEMRSLLLSMLNLGTFPPPGRHVKGMSVTMFEGLMTNTDRRIQLHSYVANGACNVRTLGSFNKQ